MGDPRLKPAGTVIAGVSGSGKTTAALRHMCGASGVACRFIFDFKPEFAARLGVRPVQTANELERAVPSGWVVFQPHRMFPGRLEDAFKFFCRWVFEVCRRGRGRKLLYVDEAWMFCSPNRLPVEVATCIQAGRMEGLEIVWMTQRPHKLNEAIVGQCTELICFTLRSSLAIDALTKEVEELDDDTPRNLPLGSFWSINRDSGAVLTGKLF